MSVASLLTSPNSKGMFSQAIMESNPLSLPFHTRESAATNAKHAFDYLGESIHIVLCIAIHTQIHTSFFYLHVYVYNLPHHIHV